MLIGRGGGGGSKNRSLGQTPWSMLMLKLVEIEACINLMGGVQNLFSWTDPVWMKNNITILDKIYKYEQLHKHIMYNKCNLKGHGRWV